MGDSDLRQGAPGANAAVAPEGWGREVEIRGHSARAKLAARAGATLDAEIAGVSWTTIPEEVARTECMLVRAGVLREDDAGPGMYFRSRPEKWDKERDFCLTLEVSMHDAGIDPAEGWDMTLGEIARHLQARDARRGLARGAR